MRKFRAGNYAAATATSPDELMSFFSQVYAAGALDFYTALLSPDYLFVDQAGGLDDDDRDLGITGKMFDEIAGDNGIVITGITVD